MNGNEDNFPDQAAPAPAAAWKQVAAQLTQLGLPVLGRALGGMIPVIGGSLGGTLGETVGNIIATAIAGALGVPPTPAAVSSAIENGQTTEVVAKLKAVEAEAAVRWPAIAAIEQSERTAEVAIASINAQASTEVAKEIVTNGFWLSLYRSIMMYAATCNMIVFGVAFFYGLFVQGSPIWQRMVDGQVLIAWWIGAMGSILGVHFFTRAQERKSGLQAMQPQVAQQPTSVTVTTNPIGK